MKQLAGIHRIAEHAPELEVADAGGDRRDVLFNGLERRVIALGAGQLEQFTAVGERHVERGQRADDAVEQLALAAELLRPLLILPDLRILELPNDLGQPHRLRIEVKDTSAARPCAP